MKSAILCRQGMRRPSRQFEPGCHTRAALRRAAKPAGAGRRNGQPAPLADRLIAAKGGLAKSDAAISRSKSEQQRLNSAKSSSIDHIYPFLENRALLDAPGDTPYAHYWAAAQTGSFRAVPAVKQTQYEKTAKR